MTTWVLLFLLCQGGGPADNCRVGIVNTKDNIAITASTKEMCEENIVQILGDRLKVIGTRFPDIEVRDMKCVSIGEGSTL